VSIGGSRMFKGFRNRRYWILLPPFLIIGIILIIFLPQELKPFSILTALPFRFVYYLWNHFSGNRNEESS
jgi:hypothetical protein